MLPLRDAFAVLFFVSIGMLVDPLAFVTHGWTIAAVLLVIVLGNGLSSFLMASAMGLSMRQRLVVAGGLAQIGEFTFLVSGVALALGIISPHTQGLILASALAAIVLNPLVFRICETLAQRSAGPAPTVRPLSVGEPSR
jgi:CPA2 family monovalent cation:H+ antiporter-2